MVNLVIRFQLGISFHTIPPPIALAIILAADTLTCEMRQFGQTNLSHSKEGTGNA